MIKQMKTFIQLSDLESIKKAAASRAMSEEEVIRQARYLESVVGVPLFKRSDDEVRLTEAGRSFYRDIIEIVYEADDAVLRARETMQHNPFIIRAGASLMNPCSELLQIWNEIKNQYPQFQLKVVPFLDEENLLEEAYHIIGKTCDVMVGIYDSVNFKEHFGMMPLGESRYSFTVSKKHRLAKKKLLSLEDLEGEYLMMERRGASEMMDQIRNLIIEKRLNITILDTPHQYDLDIFKRCARGNEVLLTLEVWDNIQAPIVSIPVDLDMKVPYGLLYPLEPEREVAQFIKSLRDGLEKNWQW